MTDLPASKMERLPKAPILIVEDRLENQVLLQALVKRLGMNSVIASNGREALEICQKQEFSLFIVDLMMPVMDGQTFIRELKNIHQDSICIVQTAIDHSDKIIEVMRMGVYDYIIKPIVHELFQSTVTRALETRYLRDVERELKLKESMLLRGQLEWLSYKESRRKESVDSMEVNSIYNLKTSLSQGSGFGSQTTLIDMLAASKIPIEGSHDSVSVSAEILQILIENNNISKSMLKGLDATLVAMETQLDLKTWKSSDLTAEIKNWVFPLLDRLETKDIKIHFPVFSNQSEVLVDAEKIRQVLFELVLNSIKYCKRESVIDIFAHITEGYLCIAVKNEIDTQSYYGGVPKNQEKLVIQPFYRIHPPVEDVATLEEFGLGLGLTVVDHILNKHNGVFSIHDATDHTTKSVSSCVIAEIFLPILKLGVS